MRILDSWRRRRHEREEWTRAVEEMRRVGDEPVPREMYLSRTRD